MRLDKPRIAPLPVADMNGAQKQLLAGMGPLEDAYNIMKTMVRHEKLLKRWLPFANHILFKSTLSARHREIVILRIGWRCQAAYEFGQHILIGKRAGLDDGDIQNIIAGPSAPGLDPFEALLLTAADELKDDAFISEPTWQALSAHYSEEQMMDLIFTAGNYNLVCMALNTLGVQLDPGVPGFPENVAKQG